jgi:hypothetical protein
MCFLWLSALTLIIRLVCFVGVNGISLSVYKVILGSLTRGVGMNAFVVFGAPLLHEERVDWAEKRLVKVCESNYERH